MFVGKANANASAPITKMTITVMNGSKKDTKITVLYNPEQYEQSRSLNVKNENAFLSNAQDMQIPSSASEELHFSLFFDTMSAGSEIGGSDKSKFSENQVKSSSEKTLSVRTYTDQIYELMKFDKSIHSVPLLKIEWSSLTFEGYLIACKQTFIKFNESGTPVRAMLDCSFRQCLNMDSSSKQSPNESPDTTKYRMISQGDSLWSLSTKEYGDPAEWRAIARANGMANPRRLRAGERLIVPAIR